MHTCGRRDVRLVDRLRRRCVPPTEMETSSGNPFGKNTTTVNKLEFLIISTNINWLTVWKYNDEAKNSSESPKYSRINLFLRSRRMNIKRPINLVVNIMKLAEEVYGCWGGSAFCGLEFTPETGLLYPGSRPERPEEPGSLQGSLKKGEKKSSRGPKWGYQYSGVGFHLSSSSITISNSGHC